VKLTDENYKDVGYYSLAVDRFIVGGPAYRMYVVSEDRAYHTLGAALVLGVRIQRYRIRTPDDWARIVVVEYSEGGTVTQVFDFNDTDRRLTDDVIHESKGTDRRGEAQAS
jgi:hypothetical protein